MLLSLGFLGIFLTNLANPLFFIEYVLVLYVLYICNNLTDCVPYIEPPQRSCVLASHKLYNVQYDCVTFITVEQKCSVAGVAGAQCGTI